MLDKKQSSFLMLIGILFLLGLLVIAALLPLHGATLPKNRPNSVGVPEFVENPNVYTFGMVTNGQVMSNEKGRKFTSILFQPYHTFALYTESILLCGDVADDFNNHQGKVVVLSYERSVHVTYKKVGCHILNGVFEVPPPSGTEGISEN